MGELSNHVVGLRPAWRTTRSYIRHCTVSPPGFELEIASCHEADCAQVGTDAAAVHRPYDVGVGRVPFRNTL